MKISTKSKRISKSQQPAKPLSTKCSYCQATFSGPQGLGGHISKAHPGLSKSYSQKVKTRELRAPQREMLEQAKRMLLDRDPTFVIRDNRSILNSLKNIMKKGSSTEAFLNKIFKK